MKLLKTALLTASVAMAASAQAVTYFEPTQSPCGCDETVQIVAPELLGTVYSIYLFENEADEATVTIADGLSLAPFSTVEFTAAGSDVTATNLATSDSITLTADSKFYLGLYNIVTDSLMFDSGSSTLSYGTEKLTFSNGTSTFVVDVKEVPVPAAAWLFGSALLGLAGIRRK